MELSPARKEKDHSFKSGRLPFVMPGADKTSRKKRKGAGNRGRKKRFFTQTH